MQKRIRLTVSPANPGYYVVLNKSVVCLYIYTFSFAV